MKIENCRNMEYEDELLRLQVGLYYFNKRYRLVKNYDEISRELVSCKIITSEIKTVRNGYTGVLWWRQPVYEMRDITKTHAIIDFIKKEIIVNDKRLFPILREFEERNKFEVLKKCWK